MNLVKIRFVHDEKPTGRPYTYIANEDVKVGDYVILDKNAVGLVVETDVPEKEVEKFKDRLKSIQGLVTAKAEQEGE